MKIAVRGGHVPKATGAIGILNELTEDRKVKDSVIKYLKQLGHNVMDVTPPDSTTNSTNDLVYGVNQANNWGADLFISIHFNKAYNSYNGAIGTEAWVYSKKDSFNDETYAQRIVDSIAALGFKNRGVKESTVLYELKSTKMPAVIVEVCFVEATDDVALYRKLGSDKIGQVIAEGIANKKVGTQQAAPSTSKPTTPTTTGTDEVRRYAETGVFYPNCTINFRKAPYVSTSNPVVGQYHKGESVKYDTVVIGQRYNWISWIGGSGNRNYMPIKDRQTGESWGYAV